MTPVMPFGKHKGTPIAQVPTPYLAWLGGKGDLKDPLRRVVAGELLKRGVAPTTDPRHPKVAPVGPAPAPEVALEAALVAVEEAVAALRGAIGGRS